MIKNDRGSLPVDFRRSAGIPQQGVDECNVVAAGVVVNRIAIAPEIPCDGAGDEQRIA